MNSSKSFYTKPFTIALANFSALFLIGLFTARREIGFADFLSISAGGVLSLFFIMSIITTHKLKQIYMDPDEVNKIITTGVYKYLRHPVYAGIVYMNIAFFLFFRTIILIPLIVFFSIIWYLEARHEEKVLVKRFGKKYENYMAKTGMFFPKL